ncbi:hypothetical protein CN330_12080 [Priestia megaterium]|uniref:hypothetical protein n=1 Tax=Priestia megaterium TaxID=1404 RepID=UPI000BF3CBD0|nr:hypothetical protein [Priestia megaterium]PEZ12861.1 hypothetical protein CN330_12080 [Priestia megaterium]
MDWTKINPTLLPAAITGSVTFVAGILSQTLAHHFTKKREKDKALKEAISILYSPLSIEMYEYLQLYGKLPEAMTIPQGRNVSEVEEELKEIWDRIIKIVEDNKPAVSMEMAHNLRQTDRALGSDLEFFSYFLKAFIRTSKKVGFKGKLNKYTLEEMLYLLKLNQILYMRYGDPAAMYIFRIIGTRHSLSIKRIYNTLIKEKFNTRDFNRNSFDDKFESLVLNNLSARHSEMWKGLITSQLALKKARANKKQGE